MLNPIEQKADIAARLILVASQRNAIPENDMDAQITDLFCNLKHLADQYNTDINECMKLADTAYKAELPIKLPEVSELRNKFVRSDLITLGDECFRLVSPDKDDEFEFIFNFGEKSYRFTKESVDKASYDDNTWSVYCDVNKRDIDIKFFTIMDITGD